MTNIDIKNSLYESTSQRSLKLTLTEDKRLSKKPPISNINEKIDSSLSIIKTLENYLSDMKSDIEASKCTIKKPKTIFGEELSELKDKINQLVQLTINQH